LLNKFDEEAPYTLIAVLVVVAELSLMLLSLIVSFVEANMLIARLVVVPPLSIKLLPTTEM
jgi:hypothetical protein